MTLLLVYCGTDYAGVDITSVESIITMFCSVDPSIAAQRVSANALEEHISEKPCKGEGWEKRVIVAFPGGRCTPWDSQLGNVVNIIRDFIIRGGNAFMVCAGAYFSVRKSTFHVPGSHDIIRERSLRLFPGSADGPKLGREGRTINVVRERDQSTAKVLLKEGGHFIPDEDARNYRVLMRYEDNDIAAVACDHGIGKAIMTFPHFEVATLPDNEYTAEINDQLKDSERFLLEFFEDSLSYFNLRAVANP